MALSLVVIRAKELDENLHRSQPHVPHFTVSIETYRCDVVSRGDGNDQQSCARDLEAHESLLF